MNIFSLFHYKTFFLFLLRCCYYCFGFALLRRVIGSENLRRFLYYSD